MTHINSFLTWYFEEDYVIMLVSGANKDRGRVLDRDRQGCITDGEGNRQYEIQIL